jgi:hypothetical protein
MCRPLMGAFQTHVSNRPLTAKNSAIAVVDRDDRIIAVRLRWPNGYDTVALHRLAPYLESIKAASGRNSQSVTVMVRHTTNHAMQ